MAKFEAFGSNVRDNQRSRVYKAERAAFQKKPLGGKRLEQMAELEAYVAKVWKRKSILAIYGQWMTRPIRIKDGRGCRSAFGGMGEINMPTWSRVEWVVLHELSHCLVDRKYGREAVAPHGREFCRVYLDLVEGMLGREARSALGASFRKHRVKYWNL